MAALVTFESVAQAAQALVESGEKASVRKVIEHLGGGSPNAVLPLLNQWKEGRRVVRSAEIQLDPRITALIAEQIESTSAAAAKAAEDRAADVQADAEAVAEAGQAAEALALDLQNQLEQAQAKIQAGSRALENLQADRERDEEVASEKIEELKIQLSGERQRADSAVQAMAKDELKLENALAQVQELKASLQALQAVEGKLHEAERKLAVADSQLTDEREKSKDLANRLAEQGKKLEIAQAEASNARIAEQRCQAVIDSAEREITGLKDQVKEARQEAKTAVAEASTAKGQLALLMAKTQPEQG